LEEEKAKLKNKKRVPKPVQEQGSVPSFSEDEEDPDEEL